MVERSGIFAKGGVGNAHNIFYSWKTRSIALVFGIDIGETFLLATHNTLGIQYTRTIPTASLG